MTSHSDSELDKKLRDISVMYELMSSIGTSLDMTVELDRFLQKLLKRFGYSLGTILIKSKERGHFVIKSVYGFYNARQLLGKECSEEHFWIGDMIRDKKPLIKNALTGVEKKLIIDPNITDKIKSFAFFPLRFEEEVLGILRLFSFSENTFTEKSTRMIVPLANRLGKAINHISTVERLLDTEESLRRSEERFKSFFDNANDAIWVHPLNSEGFSPFIAVNNTACQRYGYSQEEFLHLSVPDIKKKAPPANGSLADDRKELLASGHVVFETVHRKRSGEEFPVEINENIIDQGDGEHVILAVVRDITERKKMEKALRESEAHLRTLINTIPDLVWLKDPDGVYLACNPKFESFFGASESEIVGKTDHDFVDKKLADFFREKDRVAMAAGKPSVNEEEVTYASDGHRELLETIKTPMYGSDGSLIGVLGIARDITERKEMESRLQQAYKMEAIGTLAGGIAHDFNNILSAIVGYTELAKLEMHDSRQSASCLDQVLQSSHRASNLVKQILTFSRKGPQKREKLKPHFIVKEALKLMRASLPTTLEIQEDIDPESGEILADPTQIHQIIVNLCTNALHAMEEESGIVKVTLGRCELNSDEVSGHIGVSPGPFIKLSVSDTGCGMDKQTLQRIFEPYFTTKEVGKGTGLGLSVVLGIVQECGGMITVESDPGKGSTFDVYFPAMEEDVDKREEEEKNLALNGTERILTVDDEEAIVALHKSVLSHLSYTVTTATSSEEALAAFKSAPHSFDLLITDQTMPAMSGAKLAQEILSIRPDLPIIICTGHSSTLSEGKAKAIGIKMYLQKPVDNKTLARSIRKVLEG